MAKKAKKAKTKKPNAAPAPTGTTRVRMYRQGLGDCFLITFDVGGDEKHVLIDCGTLGATTTGVKLSQVVENIRTTTAGHLHLLIATHEHWDHVRGFHDQRTEFEEINVDKVWLPWTENPNDPLAKQVAVYKNDLGTSLARATQALAASSNSESQALGLAVRDILGFFGDDGVLGASKFSETVNAAMDFVRTKPGATCKFCKPGDGPFEEDWLPGFRFYVLGPPYDESALRDPGEHGSSELYGVAAGLKAGAAFCLAGKPATEYINAAGMEERSEFIGSLPFDGRFRVEQSSESAHTFFGKTYLAEDEAWRRIDEDWLHVASDLALQLDEATNNTSLALAIERIVDGKVLLFPADAQQGNWLSWHHPKLKWKVKDGTTEREVRAADLLARTVFYKVGHHASHNATAKAKGLEMMDGANGLTAFVPVDRQVALGRHPKGSWRMPAFKLYRRLLEKCEGRVLRSDIGWADDATAAANTEVEKELVGVGTKDEWGKWKAAQAAANVQISNMYVDYLLD